MQTIHPSKNTHQWPRSEAKTVECRKRDLVIRITNWLSDKDEPGYDVEVYIGGVYDWNESQCFTLWTEAGPNTRTPAEAKKLAIAYTQAQIAKLL